MTPETDHAALVQTMVRNLRGHWITQMLYVAARLEIADHLGDAGLSVPELAARCTADPDSLHRLLRALASIGVFRESHAGHFVTTPQADLLRGDHPHSLRWLALMQGEERYWAWGDLLDTIRSGEGAFARRFGQTVFEWNRSHPQAGAIFDRAMAGSSVPEIQALLAAFDFAACREIVDVGGGNGLTLQRLLEAHPHLRGTLFDRAEVIERAATPRALASRWRAISGNALEAVPSGADLYLLKNVLHDWDDTTCLTILRSIRRAMQPMNSRLLIYELLIHSGNDPCPGKLLDLNMLVIHGGGRERSLESYRNLVSEAGLQIHAVLPTSCAMHVLEVIQP